MSGAGELSSPLRGVSGSDLDYRPPPWPSGGHADTVLSMVLRQRARPKAGQSGVLDVPVAPASSVRLEADRPDGPPPRGTVLLVHGLGGSAGSGYMLAAAAAALRRGWAAVRMNCRTCGGTESLSRTTYNATQSGDVRAALGALQARGFPRPYVSVGFSLGGHLVLRQAAHAGREGPRADAVLAVSPPVDLEATAGDLERGLRSLYGAYFTWLLCRQLERFRRSHGLTGRRAVLRRVRTLRRFDEWFTAPAAGFPSASAYYRTASTRDLLERLGPEVVVLHALNDPVVAADLVSEAFSRSPARLLLTSRGGHVGWWERTWPGFYPARILDRLLREMDSGARS